MLLPLQGALHRFIIPRAMPWAMRSLPLRGVPHRFIIPRAMPWAMCSLPLQGVLHRPLWLMRVRTESLKSSAAMSCSMVRCIL